MIHKNVVDAVDAKYPSIEERGTKIYKMFKEKFESENIEDYDLDCFAIYWLATRVVSELEFAKPEIVALNGIIFHRHYRVLWEKLLKETPSSPLPSQSSGGNEPLQEPTNS